MPLQTPQRKNNELTRMKVKTRLAPSGPMKRRFVSVLIE
jgi:hypothetical protein